MLHRPRFRPDLKLYSRGDRVFIVTTEGHREVKNQTLATAVTLVNGERTSDDIAEALTTVTSLNQAFYLLERLEKRGILVENSEQASPWQESWWAGLGVNPKTAEERLSEAGLRVTTFGDVNPSWSGGLSLPQSPQGGYRLVAVDDYLRPELADYNLRRLEKNEPWMLCRPTGPAFLLGPLFSPGTGPCWNCLAHWLRPHRRLDRLLFGPDGGLIERPKASTRAALLWFAGTVSSQLERWVGQGRVEKLQGRILLCDAYNLQISPHPVLKIPQCRACGESLRSDRIPPPPRLESRLKVFTDDGGHRSCSPRTTVERLTPFISPLTGIVREVWQVSGSSTPVFVAPYVGNGAPYESLPDFHSDLRRIACGKGLNEDQSLASCLSEAIERHSCFFRGDEPFRVASYEELGDAAIHPNAIMKFSAAQLRSGDGSPRPKHRKVPVRPFDDKAQLSWSPVWSVSKNTSRFIPTALCYYRIFPEDQNAELMLVPESNGCAAGNTLEEAVFQGFLELVERDAVACWWYSRVKRPGVDLGSFREDRWERVLSDYRRVGRELWVLDLTHDLEVPVFAAVSRRIRGKQERLCLGFGAHLDTRIAISRALSECSQMVPELRRNGLPLPKFKDIDYQFTDARWWFERASIENQPYLAPDPRRLTTAHDHLKPSNRDLLEDIELCRDLVERRGMELLILDITRPEVGFPVVKVFVPELRNFWPRFAPGRLYDVPLAEGWLKEPLTEEQLNPIPIFF